MLDLGIPDPKTDGNWKAVLWPITILSAHSKRFKWGQCGKKEGKTMDTNNIVTRLPQELHENCDFRSLHCNSFVVSILFWFYHFVLIKRRCRIACKKWWSWPTIMHIDVFEFLASRRREMLVWCVTLSFITKEQKT